jgi:demethylmenaquinone methyltransferase/2-methoxy-6-polyprenyl-1,4-benzoquinol methylase
MNNRIFSRKEVQNIYDRVVSLYDLSLFLFKIIGFYVQKYRRKAIQNLHLKKGDTVIDLGYGTGLNFNILQEKVGPEGKIIGLIFLPGCWSKPGKR